VTVNGVELDDTVSSSDTGWAYDSATYLLTLDGAGPVTLSGENWDGAVQILVPAGVTNIVTLSDLSLWSSYDCAFALETNANVSLVLEGENTLGSGNNRAGIEVPLGASLSITNAPGDDVAALEAYGGWGGRASAAALTALAARSRFPAAGSSPEAGPTVRVSAAGGMAMAAQSRFPAAGSPPEVITTVRASAAGGMAMAAQS
jgi:hypothetical protein